jgi:NAD(P) transhydrogenase subunit alpha
VIEVDLSAMVFIFILSGFLGFELISRVPSQLHTPLMSGSNAISGITVIGAILALGNTGNSMAVTICGFLAVILAMVNVVSGYCVTERMLKMFDTQKK